MNSITIVGRLTDEPEMNYTGNGAAYTTFKLADNPRQKGDEPIFRRVKAWRQLAEICSEHLHKGMLVAVVGHERAYKYTDKNNTNQERIGQEVVIEEMEICS